MKSIEHNKLDKISSTDFKSSYIKIAKIIKANPKPYEITENDKTDLIVMSSEFFESMMDLIEDQELISKTKLDSSVTLSSIGKSSFKAVKALSNLSTWEKKPTPVEVFPL